MGVNSIFVLLRTKKTEFTSTWVFLENEANPVKMRLLSGTLAVYSNWKLDYSKLKPSKLQTITKPQNACITAGVNYFSGIEFDWLGTFYFLAFVSCPESWARAMVII